jgi:hypothetical protein
MIYTVRSQVLTAASMKMVIFWVVFRVVWQKYTDVSEVPAASIIRAIALKMVQQPRIESSSHDLH